MVWILKKWNALRFTMPFNSLANGSLREGTFGRTWFTIEHVTDENGCCPPHSEGGRCSSFYYTDSTTGLWYGAGDTVNLSVRSGAAADGARALNRRSWYWIRGNFVGRYADGRAVKRPWTSSWKAGLPLSLPTACLLSVMRILSWSCVMEISSSRATTMSSWIE